VLRAPWAGELVRLATTVAPMHVIDTIRARRWDST